MYTQVLAFVLYQFVVSFLLEPTAMKAFNHTLDRLKSDPRITVRLGSSDDIRGVYGWGLRLGVYATGKLR